MKPELRLTQEEFNELGEYSCSLPTGTTIGKRWKCRRPFEAEAADATWFIGEYVPSEEPGMVGIKWYSPRIMNSDETLIRNRLYGVTACTH